MCFKIEFLNIKNLKNVKYFMYKNKLKDFNIYIIIKCDFY